MNREQHLERVLGTQVPFDLAVVGAGATGAGIALDAASRGLSVVLLERGGFGAGTSSRSSKLVHGGVRYLALGQIPLVREALAERGLLLANAGALVRPLPFLLPAGGALELLKYRVGLKLYDWLAGRAGIEPSRAVGLEETRALAPGLATTRLRGAVRYADAGFDDARLLIALVRRSVEHGALALNHVEVIDILKRAGRVHGIGARDLESGRTFEVPARCVVNAAGPWGDTLRRLDEAQAPAATALSQGAHVVVDGHYLDGRHALVLPHTPDGRIMFAVPWHGRTLLGTTDTAIDRAPAVPRPLADEVTMILDVAAAFLDPAPGRDDVRAVFAGIRPLAAAPVSAGTAKISREHAVTTSASGLVSVTGGKWTTYRRMAEDCMDIVLATSSLQAGPCRTRVLPISLADRSVDDDCPLGLSGAERRALAALVDGEPALGEAVHPALPYVHAHIAWAVREEMALHVVDALAYHTRAAFIDADAALAAVPAVARTMADALGRGPDWVATESRAAAEALGAFRLDAT